MQESCKTQKKLQSFKNFAIVGNYLIPFLPPHELQAQRASSPVAAADLLHYRNEAKRTANEVSQIILPYK